MAPPPRKKENPPILPGQKFAIITLDQVRGCLFYSLNNHVHVTINRKPFFFFLVTHPQQIFDVQFVAKYRTSARPVGLEEDPETLHKLIKCATLAIWDYNSQHKTDYRFLNIEMATWQLASGNIFNVTFKCKNAKKENQYTSFQATVYQSKRTRNVERIRMKESSTW